VPSGKSLAFFKKQKSLEAIIVEPLVLKLQKKIAWVKRTATKTQATLTFAFELVSSLDI